MRSKRWKRDLAIASIRSDVWRYVSQASKREEDLALEAAALLQMQPREVRTLARIQFILSEPARELIAGMPSLSRRLTNSALPEEERSVERVRGPIRWGETFSQRASMGLPHLFVTAPARRAFQTPENEVLVEALTVIRDQGHQTGWDRRGTHLSPIIRSRVEQSDRWLRTRALTEVERRPVTPRLLSRVRSGRAINRYRPAVEICQLHQKYLRRLDVTAVQAAVENFAIVAAADEVLLELLALFEIERVLSDQGWSLKTPGLIEGGGRVLQGIRHGDVLDVYYQHTPKRLSAGSQYEEVQRTHSLSVGALRPDLIFSLTSKGRHRWIIVEVKGLLREVQESARDALQNLLAYRRAFDRVLSSQEGTYGLGIAWGEELAPRESEAMLCTPDTLGDALVMLFPEP